MSVKVILVLCAQALLVKVGGFGVASASSVPPVGIAIASENVYEDGLPVVGDLPLLGTVSLEKVPPTASADDVKHGCGNGGVDITITGIGAGPVLVEGFYDAGLGLGYNGLCLDGIGYGLGECDC